MMTRTLPHLIGVLAFALLVHGSRIEARTNQKAVNVATSVNPIRIAVLSDHYTDESEFDFDVQNLITNALLTHPYYATHKAELEIASFYDPLPAGSQSNYGFDVEVPSGNCVLSSTVSNDDTNTVTRIGEVVKNFNPKHTIVIGNHPYNIGCTDNGWTYVARSINGSGVLPHELGHALAGLLDEWFFEANRGVSHPGLDDNLSFNCFDTRPPGTTAPWLPTPSATPFPGAGSYPGCDLYELDVIHAYPPQYNGHTYCLMGASHGAEFCPVCHSLMEKVFEDANNPDFDNPDVSNPDVSNPDIENPTPKRPGPPTNQRIVKIAYEQPAPGTVKPVPPPQPPPAGATLKPVAPRPIVRLIAAFDPVSGTLRPKKSIPITAQYSPSHRRLGEWAYEVVVNGRTYVGVIPSNLFRTRTYQGGVAHQSSAPHEADITIQIPDVTGDALKAGTANVAIRIYKLSSNVTEGLITPAVFAKLKAGGQAEPRGAAVTAKDLLGVM
jgi:hypothetical protein